MTGLDEESDVGVHEGHCHVDVDAVGEHEFFAEAEDFDEGEDVVPSAAVEAADVIFEFVDDL